eukprot:CAMPEP_0182593600 /NCGR_PEP_ID=MMETSP1324-20130603/78373_1 /TAXON_ID=236786 /ORGANISM="Florenciella sp., Strain RCC1587" /LENGTH=68 /DNA_ID=CAMNT_0024811077 /DNA_START=423 /DNA_END=630 /DNA_ORIENTATION=+
MVLLVAIGGGMCDETAFEGACRVGMGAASGFAITSRSLLLNGVDEVGSAINVVAIADVGTALPLGRLP